MNIPKILTETEAQELENRRESLLKLRTENETELAKLRAELTTCENNRDEIDAKIEALEVILQTNLSME